MFHHSISNSIWPKNMSMIWFSTARLPLHSHQQLLTPHGVITLHNLYLRCTSSGICFSSWWGVFSLSQRTHFPPLGWFLKHLLRMSHSVLSSSMLWSFYSKQKVDMVVGSLRFLLILSVWCLQAISINLCKTELTSNVSSNNYPLH